MQRLLIVGFLTIGLFLTAAWNLPRSLQFNPVTNPTATQRLPLAQTVTPTNNLEVSTATYLGDSGDDQANAVDVAPDNTLVLGGTMPGFTPDGITPTDLLGGGDGVVIRFNSTGREILSLTRIGNQINDLEINGSGLIVVCGDFGVATLNSDAANSLWHQDPGAVNRCAIDDNGTVAAIRDAGPDTAHVYDSGGNSLGTWDSGSSGRHYYDVAIDAANGGQVFLSGYDQKASDLQVAFLNAWSYAGVKQWDSYDFSASDTKNANKGADTRGERIVVGNDGLLYFAGSINGGTGASIFSRDPKDINQTVGDKTVTTDEYNNPFNIGSVKMTWYGRYSPASGDLILGQSLLTRLSSGKGNSIVAKALDADENGRLYVAGNKSADLENREQRQINGNPVGNYEGSEGFLLIVSPDFQQRIVWTPFARSGFSAGGSPANGVAVRNGLAAVGLTHNDAEGDPAKRRLITTGSPLQAEPPAPSQEDSDGYLVVWPQIGVDSAPLAVSVAPSIGFVGSNTFRASVFPTTTALPLTYTWHISGTTVQTSTASFSRVDTLVYTWPVTTPAQTLVITAENAKGVVSATYTFDVVEAQRVYLPLVTKG